MAPSWTLCVAVLLLAVAAAAAPGGGFSEAATARRPKHDDLDVDRMLKNRRFVAAAIKCLLDEGPCTPDVRELKKMLPDALKSDCSSCSPKQKENVRKVVDFMMKQRSAEWERLSKKYDPDGQHKKRIEEKLREQEKLKEAPTPSPAPATTS